MLLLSYLHRSELSQAAFDEAGELRLFGLRQPPSPLRRQLQVLEFQAEEVKRVDRLEGKDGPAGRRDSDEC